jgi:hypothetical protein
MKRLGPELKMPKSLKPSDLKVPPFLSDLYLDLRDRRLLPLIALIIVGILAVPFLLGGSDKSETPRAVKPIGGEAQALTTAQTFTVVQARPGLRNYRKRLRRKPVDPFKQRYTGPVLAGSQLNAQTTTTTSTSESSSSSETVVTSPSGSPSNGVGEGGGNSENGGGGSVPSSENPNLQLYIWKTKIQISRTETAPDGSVKMGAPVIHEVKSLTPLPGEKTPVVTFIGVNPSTNLVVLQVSREVTALFGDGKCISGTGSCELVEIEKGFPETFEYGPGHVRYKFKVIKIELVRAPKP